MTFKRIYDAMPKVIRRGTKLINKGIAHVERMRAVAQPEVQKQADSAINEGLNRIATIERLAGRIQSQLRALAAMCYDGSIPEPKDVDEVV